MRRVIQALLLLALLGAGVALYAFLEARRDPVVRRATIALPRWPAGAAPVRLVLISDIHIGSAAMDAARLTRIVAQINALHPDIVAIAGDFIFGHRHDGALLHGGAMIAPLKGLHARLGVVAVPGNHDHWTGMKVVTRQIAAAGVTLLRNDSVVLGPIALGGVDDDYSGYARLDATMAELRASPGARVLLTHSPDIAARLPADAPLLLAGHTHCGQIVLPLIGPLSEVSHFRGRFRCGLIREGRHATIVTAGLGASGVPFRLGAPPDLWLLTLGP